jgi:hypothetical protein
MRRSAPGRRNVSVKRSSCSSPGPSTVPEPYGERAPGRRSEEVLKHRPGCGQRGASCPSRLGPCCVWVHTANGRLSVVSLCPAPCSNQVSYTGSDQRRWPVQSLLAAKREANRRTKHILGGFMLLGSPAPSPEFCLVLCSSFAWSRRRSITNRTALIAAPNSFRSKIPTNLRGRIVV